MEGLNFPGRFLVRLGAADGRAVLDPFDDGKMREASSLRELLKQSAGSLAELAPEHFAAVEDRHYDPIRSMARVASGVVL